MYLGYMNGIRVSKEKKCKLTLKFFLKLFFLKEIAKKVFGGPGGAA